MILAVIFFLEKIWKKCYLLIHINFNAISPCDLFPHFFTILWPFSPWRFSPWHFSPCDLFPYSRKNIGATLINYFKTIKVYSMAMAKNVTSTYVLEVWCSCWRKLKCRYVCPIYEQWQLAQSYWYTTLERKPIGIGCDEGKYNRPFMVEKQIPTNI